MSEVIDGFFGWYLLSGGPDVVAFARQAMPEQRFARVELRLFHEGGEVAESAAELLVNRRTCFYAVARLREVMLTGEPREHEVPRLKRRWREASPLTVEGMAVRLALSGPGAGMLPVSGNLREEAEKALRRNAVCRAAFAGAQRLFADKAAPATSD